MKRVFTFSLCYFVFQFVSFAQLDQYTSEQNKFYWKNRKPTTDYWQQDVYYNITTYVEDKVNDITQQLNQFVEDNGHFLSVNDARTIDIIRNNPAERRRYLKTLLDARALISKYGNIASVKVDKSVDSDNTIAYVERLQNAIKQLTDTSIIEQAEKLFANDYLAKLSDNPQIQKI